LAEENRTPKAQSGRSFATAGPARAAAPQSCYTNPS